MQAGLAEFASIKHEIQVRSTAQLTLLGLNVAAVGAIGSFAISQRQTVLLLLLTIVCPALGLFFLDHDRHIRAMGDHIRLALWPTIGRELPSWELHSEPMLARPAVRRFYLVPLLILFGGPPLAALLVALLAAYLNRPQRVDASSILVYAGLIAIGLPTLALWCWASYNSSLNPFRRRPPARRTATPSRRATSRTAASP